MSHAEPKTRRPAPDEERPCVICGKMFAGNRRRVCSDTCSRERRRQYGHQERRRIQREIVTFQREYLKKARRECLACGRKFASEGPWNRLCKLCKSRAAYADDQTVPRRMP